MLRTTAIMKTDIQGSTARFRMLCGADLEALLREHREFVTRLAGANEGRVAKLEGDGLWVVFPSVTDAALTAMSMQEELRLAQTGKGDARVAMRIVITLGDVLYQEGSLVGEAVVLAARIEEITPPDEIYLSTSAWLAMNRAEVRASLVDTFQFKGFSEPSPVYRIEQTHRMRVIPDQVIVATDLHAFGTIAENSPLALVEKILDRLLDLVSRVCSDFSGKHRSNAGDTYLLTFPDAQKGMAAVERLAEEWNRFQQAASLRCPMNVAVHKGVLYAFRSYLLSRDINIAWNLEKVTSRLSSSGTSIFLTGDVRKELAGTRWDDRLSPVDIRASFPRLADIEIYRLDPKEPESH